MSVNIRCMVETVHYWQIFCVLSDNSTLLNCHFEIIETYRPVLALFWVLFLSRSSDKVSFRATGHICLFSFVSVNVGLLHGFLPSPYLFCLSKSAGVLIHILL